MSNQISKHISYSEGIVTSTKFKNEPNEQQLEAMKLVAEKCFEPLREWYGKPIKINSFFRSKEVNTAVKGSPTSDHMKGMSIDIDAGSRSENLKLFNWLKANVKFKQLIHEYGDKSGPDWVHVSYDPKDLRNQVLYIK